MDSRALVERLKAALVTYPGKDKELLFVTISAEDARAILAALAAAPVPSTLSEQLKAIPTREEYLGGQRTKYVQLDTVLAIVEAAAPVPPAQSILRDVERLRVLAQLSARGTDGNSWGLKSEIDRAASRLVGAITSAISTKEAV